MIDVKADPKKGEIADGTIRIEGSLDAVIDGSARDSTMRATSTVSVTGSRRGEKMGQKTTGQTEKTVKTAKEPEPRG